MKRTALRKSTVTFLFSLLFFFSAGAQTEACRLRITLLTCSPGEELYSTFGHTALRVVDSTAGSDLVFNYGTFEFSPDFYQQFILGKLLYSLSVESFPDFLYTYQVESRSVVEQELQLSCADKQRLFSALQTNALPENRSYLYDFLFDNCTTRARDIVAQTTVQPVVFQNILPAEVPTFRDLIHTYLDRGGQYWSKLGIDMLLGMKLDRKVTNQQAMFLPDNLLKGFDSARVNRQPLVTPPKDVLIMPSPLNSGSLFRPAVVFTLLLVAGIILSFTKKRKAQKALSVLDFLLFFVTGLAGWVMLFMWLGTDHKVCGDNLNLWWALPTHAVAAYFVHANKGWVRLYFKAVFWLTLVLLLAWAFLPQYLPSALLPLVFLLLVRCGFLSKTIPYAGKRTVV